MAFYTPGFSALILLPWQTVPRVADSKSRAVLVRSLFLFIDVFIGGDLTDHATLVEAAFYCVLRVLIPPDCLVPRSYDQTGSAPDGLSSERSVSRDDHDQVG